MTQRGPLVRGRGGGGNLCDPQQQRHISFYDARGRYTASKRQHRAAALGSLLVRVRTPRARRDVDQGRVLADEGSAGAVSIDVAGGTFPDELAQRIAKAEARTFTNLNHGGLSFGPWWGQGLRRFNTRSSRNRDPALFARQAIQIAMATYHAARKRWPKAAMTLRQDTRVIADSRRTRIGTLFSFPWSEKGREGGGR